MSSSEDSGPPKASRQRRLPHACDNCRKRKVKCDSAQKDGRCTNCVGFGIPCEHTIPSKRRNAQKGYVEALEGRIKMMEDLLAKHAQRTLTEADGLSAPTSITGTDGTTPPSHGTSPPSHASPEAVERENEYERMQAELVNNMNRVRVTDCYTRYFGPASTFHLVSTALSTQANGDELRGDPARQPEVYQRYHENIESLGWDIMPWEHAIMQEEAYEPLDFPDDDLLRHLTDVYFEIPNNLLPVLHRPTFERELREGLHKRDWYFGAVVLMVCASASRYTDDPRVLLPGTSDQRSAGWKWYSQLPLIRQKPLWMLPSLHELQYYAIALTCVHGTSAPQSSWAMIGVSLRYCQELGIHRKSSDPHFVHNEHYTRVFWSLVTIDRLISSTLGRQPCITADDIDADLPVECDDEYWDTGNPATVFKQPPRIPSKLAFFSHYVKITDILSHALSALYTTAKSRIRSGNVGPEWERRVASELDSELNEWLEGLPDHLRWDPKRENRLFFDQSSVLFATYYHVQHTIHRPFIGKSSPVTFASVAMCCNAARACSRVFAAQVERGNPIVTSELLVGAFMSAVSCVMNMWGGRKMGMTIDQRREMEYVQNCIRYLEACEAKWLLAGRFKGLIRHLVNIHDAQANPDHISKKRPRDEYESSPSDTMSSGPPTTAQHTPSDSTSQGGAQPDVWDSADSSTYWNVNNLLFPPTVPTPAPPHSTMQDQGFAQQRCYDPFVSLPDPSQMQTSYSQQGHTSAFEGLSEADFASLPAPVDDVFNMWSQLPSTNDPQTWESYIMSLDQPKANGMDRGMPDQTFFSGH
ncbi:fungal-specific transcription factor domain-containing protein [Schizophyllum commune]